MLNGLVTRQLFRDGSSVQIEFRDELRNKRVYKTVINKLTEDHVYLSLPEERPIPIHPGTKLSVMIYDASQSNNYYFVSEVVDYKNGNPSGLTISMPVPIETFSSRRKFFRCDVDLPFSYIDSENVEQKGKAVNLSASGLMAVIFFDIHLKPAKLLDCSLTLPTILEPLKFTAKIIRIEHIEKEYQRALAMNFENITEKFQNVITKYLFQRQRELIKLGQIKVGRI